MNQKRLLIILAGIAVVVAGILFSRTFLKKTPTTEPDPIPTLSAPTGFTVSSPAFSNYSQIPDIYTCEGQNISPPINIYNVPEFTQSMVLVISDLDAPKGTFIHWLIWNITPDTTEIAQGSMPPGTGAGVNDFNHTEYSGPCPPSGEHRYELKIYALDKYLVFTEKARMPDVLDQMNTHVIAETQFYGIYSR